MRCQDRRLIQHGVCRAAEDELVGVADEKDTLVPQLEEAKWRARQAEKELEAAREASAATEQV